MKRSPARGIRAVQSVRVGDVFTLVGRTGPKFRVVKVYKAAGVVPSVVGHSLDGKQQTHARIEDIAVHRGTGGRGYHVTAENPRRRLEGRRGGDAARGARERTIRQVTTLDGRTVRLPFPMKEGAYAAWQKTPAGREWRRQHLERPRGNPGPTHVHHPYVFVRRATGSAYGGSDFPTLEKARARGRKLSARLRHSLDIQDVRTGQRYPLEALRTNKKSSRATVQRRRSTRKAGRSVAGGGRYVAQEMRALKRGSSHVRTPAQAVAVGLERARAAGVKVPRRNPPLVIVNPPGAARVVATLGYPVEIRYRHAQDGHYYKHAFKTGDVIELLADGSFRVRNKRGKTLWGDF